MFRTSINRSDPFRQLGHTYCNCSETLGDQAQCLSARHKTTLAPRRKARTMHSRKQILNHPPDTMGYEIKTGRQPEFLS